ncbi:MAG TPA: VOC family protein [Solirubrobacteraceae bacterium]|jgi:catechol 2,3-dioxygenase-like lactoylglutathione lyase family enzyme|nr:VOC family protein [Solirubrobacteraceae bacterium]
MFDHVTIRVNDFDVSRGFFATVLAPLGVEPTLERDTLVAWQDFMVSAHSDERPPTGAAHIAFAAPSHEHVDSFWQAGVDAGNADAGAPGIRPQYRDDYYGAFLLDPDGNSVEAVSSSGAGHARAGGVIDHLWLRVSDLATASDFYRRVADAAGFAVTYAQPDRTTFVDEQSGGSFSLVPGPPTANLHIAFPGDEQAVRRFHESEVAAGYRSNGEPGERAQYHAGYYAAFVLDPDGNNIELVEHHRA